MKILTAAYDELREFEDCLTPFTQDKVSMDMGDTHRALDKLCNIINTDCPDRLMNYLYCNERKGGLTQLWKDLNGK